MCLPFGADLVRDVKVKNKLETNSVVEVIGQGTKSLMVIYGVPAQACHFSAISCGIIVSLFHLLAALFSD